MPMILDNPNAFAVMGTVRDLMVQTGRKADWPEVEARMKSGDYANLCEVAKEASFGCILVAGVTTDDEPDDDLRMVVR